MHSLSGKESAWWRERANRRDRARERREMVQPHVKNEREARSSREVECIHSQLKKAHAEENERPEETDERRNSLGLR
jgi:hypothetical protein